MPLDDLTAVVVDDDDYSRSFAEEVTKMVGLKVQSFLQPLDAMRYMKENPVDLIVTDFQMPGMDGLTLVREVRKVHGDIPIVMMTGHSDARDLIMSSNADSVSELFPKPFSASDFFDRVKPLANRRQYSKFIGAYRLKEDEFRNHRARVSHYSRIIAEGLNWGPGEQDLIYYATQSHDLGMVSVPDSIFSKGEGLSPDEKDIVKMHPVIGRSMLHGSANPYFQAACTISLMHHERFNGSGYPMGLSGDAIPVEARIAGMVDVFDVLTSVRPYKEAWSFDKAFGFMRDNHEMLFDPEIVSVFEEKAGSIKEVYTRLAE